MNTHVAIDLAKLETSASKTPVRDYIHELAAQNRLRCVPTKFDELADEITSHAGDDISLDETECLIIELQRAALISHSFDGQNAILVAAHAELAEQRQ